MTGAVVPSYAGGEACSRHVHKILTNPVYCGHVIHQGKVVYRNAHEAAVDDETFERVQAKRKLKARLRKDGGGNGASRMMAGPAGLLTPFLRCGTCGGQVRAVVGSVVGQRTWLYFCGTRRDNTAACPGVSVRIDKLDPLIMDAIERQVLAPDNVRVLLDDTLMALSSADQDHAEAERERLTALVAELDRKIRLAATHAINGMIDEGDAKAITAPLLAQRETARLQLAALPARRPVPGADEVDPERFREAVLEAWK